MTEQSMIEVVKELKRLRHVLHTIEQVAAVSFAAARDVGVVLAMENEILADEVKNLAENCKQIEQLAKSRD